MTAFAEALWSPREYCVTAPAGERLPELAAGVYDRVCRTGFGAPGFCLIDLGPGASSTALRRFMIDLKSEMRRAHRARTGRDLVLVSAARFDQQVTTKPHRDGGPDESLLLLGYEPSPVASELAVCDYSRCAHDMGLTPAEFLERHNPMFEPPRRDRSLQKGTEGGGERLRPYTTSVACFSNGSFQVLLINNSVAPYSPRGETWQGLLHTATVRNPSDALRRVVNSLMVASVPAGEPEPVPEAGQEAFVRTEVVRRRGYDRTHLDDDA